MTFPRARRFGRGLAIAGMTIFTIVVAVVAALQIPAVATWATNRLVALVPLSPGYALDVGGVSGNWLTHLSLRDVVLRRGPRELVRLERLAVGYNPLQLRGPDRRLRRLIVDGGSIAASRGPDGWDLASALRSSPDDTAATGGAFLVDRLELRGIDVEAHLAPDSTARVRGFTLLGRDLVAGDTLLATIDTLGAKVAPPGDPPLWFSLAAAGAATADAFRLDPLRISSHRSDIAGRAMVPRSFDVTRIADLLEVKLEARPLALADLAAVYPGVVPDGELTLDMAATSEGRLVTAQLAARLDSASIGLEGSTVMGGGPAVYRVRGEVSALDPSRLHRSAPMGAINGVVEADLRGETLAVADGHASLRLRGSRVATTELRDLDLKAEVTRGRADLRVAGDLLGGTIRAQGWARPFDSVPSYDLAGGARGLEGTESVARALAGEDGAPVLDLRFEVEGDGIAPRDANLRGRLDMTAVRSGGDRVPLGDARLSLADGRMEIRPKLLVAGGTVTGIATVSLGDTIAYEVRGGRVEDVDLGRLMDDTVAAPLSGRFRLSGRGTAPEEAVVAATLEVDELRYAARRVEELIARARVEGGRVRLDLRGAVQGGRLTLAATARPFDSVTSFRVSRAALDSVDLGTLLGQPTLAGPVTLAGSGDGSWGETRRRVKGSLTLAPSRLGRIELSAGEASAELSGERLGWELDLTTSGGSLSLAGEGRPMAEAPSYLVREGRVESLDLGTLLGNDSLSTAIDAGFSGSLAGTALDSLLARVDLQLRPSRVNQAELGPGRLTLELNRGDLEADLRLEGGDATLAAELTGQVGTDRSQVRAEGDLRVERLSRWTGDTVIDGRVEGRFGLDLVADSSGLSTVGGTVTALGGAGDLRVRQLYVAFRPSPGAIAVDTLTLASNALALSGGGRIPLRSDATAPGDTFRLKGRTGDITPLAALAGADSIALDSTLVDLAVTGPPDRRQVRGRVDAYRLLYGNSLAERLTLEGGGAIDSAGMGAVAGRLQVDGAAAGNVSVRRIDLTGRYDSLVALQGTVRVNDEIGLAVDLVGNAAGDTTSATLRRFDLAEGGRRWRLVRPAGIALRPKAVEVDGFALDAGDRSVTIDGLFTRRDSSELTLRIVNFELGALAQARLVPVAGRLDGTLRLSGPAQAPSVEGEIGLAVREQDGDDVGRIDTKLAWTRAGLRLDATAGHRDQGGALTIAGTLPWRFTLMPPDTAAGVGFAREPADTMSLTVRADSFALALFEPMLPEQTATGLTGALALDAHIGGNPDQPRATGTVDLRDLGVELPTLGVTYSEGRLVGDFEGTRLRIDTLRLATGDDEELLASGNVILEPLADPALAIDASLQDFLVSDSDQLRAVATGDLELAGTAGKPVLTGQLRLNEAEIIVGGPSAAAVEEVELTPADRTQLAQRFGPGVLAEAEAETAFLDRFRMNLDLNFPRRVWFRKTESPSMNIELSGKINLRQEPGEEMEFFGQVQPIPGRGELDLYGRSFRLTEGEIALRGPVEAVTLDVTAQYQVPTEGDPDAEEVLINVRASGSPDSLDLQFDADPSMPQEDIISYIVTGRPASDNPFVGQGGGGGFDATQVAVNQLAETLGGAAGEELGFDVFTIRQEPERGLTLTAGRYIASRLFVSLQQPLRIGSGADQQNTGATGPGFELEYGLRQWLRSTLRGGSLPTSLLLRGRRAF